MTHFRGTRAAYYQLRYSNVKGSPGRGSSQTASGTGTPSATSTRNPVESPSFFVRQLRDRSVTGVGGRLLPALVRRLEGHGPVIWSVLVCFVLPGLAEPIAGWVL